VEFEEREKVSEGLVIIGGELNLNSGLENLEPTLVSVNLMPLE